MNRSRVASPLSPFLHLIVAVIVLMLTVPVAFARSAAPPARADAALPTLASVTPASGIAAGGTIVTITGTNLAGAIVTFGDALATVVTNDGTVMTVTAPPNPGRSAVDVTATTPQGRAALLGGFHYVVARSCFDFSRFDFDFPGVPGRMSTADFDRDGVDDLLVSYFESPGYGIAVVRGNSIETFGALTKYTFGSSVTAFGVGDFNGDGRQDVAFSNATSAILIFLRNDSGGFTAAGAIPVSTWVEKIVPGDFNEDGRQDLVIVGGGSDYWIALANPDGTFSLPDHRTFPIPVWPSWAAVGDFNSDGHQDILIAHGYDIVVLRGNGSGTFEPPVSSSNGTAVSPEGVAIGDFNTDGRQDLAVLDRNSDKLAIFAGTADGTFAAQSFFSAASQQDAVAVADFNGDGHDDVAVSGYATPEVVIFHGDGTGGFAAPITIATRLAPFRIDAGDLNGDGRPDLVVQYASGNPSILWNRCLPSITSSLTPALGPTTGGQSVSFSGKYLDGAISATFGGTAATITSTSSTSITVTTPVHAAGVVDVTVTTAEGRGTKTAAYTYDTPPLLNPQSFSVLENAVTGTLVGTVVATDPDPGSHVTFSITAGASAFALNASTGAITVAGVIDYEANAIHTLTVVASDGFCASSATVTINVVNQPTVIAGMMPATGQAAGGQIVRFTGADLSGVTSVKFGGVDALLGGGTSTSFEVTTPAHNAGLVDITITTAGGTLILKDAYTFVVPVTSCVDFGVAAPSRIVFGSNPFSIRLGDFNEDGTKDFVVADPSTDQIFVIIGRPDGTFATPVAYVQHDVWWVAIADVDGNGHQDLVVANRTVDGKAYGRISILLGTGTGTFNQHVTIDVSAGVTSLATGDFNRDGRVDLALAESSNRVEILTGDGLGRFTPGTTAAVGTNPFDVAVGDFNGDGRQDLAVPNMNSGNLSVLLATGDATFAPAVAYPLGGSPLYAAVADFNGDGRQDLVVAKYGGSVLSVLLGNGNGTFGPKADYPVGANPRTVAIGDFNGDGRQDIVAANYVTSYISLLTGRGDGTFAPKADFDVGFGVGVMSVVAHDFNGDGRQDVVVTSTNSTPGPAVSIMLNLCGPVITSVAPVKGLAVGGDTVTITGRQLESATSVRFGGTAATIGANTTGSISVTTPAHAAGAVDVVVTTGSGTATRANAFTFDNPPVVDDQTLSVREDAAMGAAVGTVVAIDPDPSPSLRFSINGGSGYGLFAMNSATGAVVLNSKLDYESVTSYTLQVSVSDGFFSDAAVVTINVVDVNEPPTLAGITPAFGIGGTTATITGTNLAGVTAVTFGGTPAVLGANTRNSITVTTPAHAPGLVDVAVTTPYGSATLSGAYDYTSASACFKLRPSGLYPAAAPWSIAVADFNGDGRQDFAVAPAEGDVKVMLAGSGGAFTTAWSNNFDGNAFFVATADFNGDHKQDLVLSNGWKVAVYLGDGHGLFGEGWSTAYNFGGMPVTGDFNGDGNQDVAFLDLWYLYDVVLVPGRGDGTFDSARASGIALDDFASATVADFNGDGLTDLAIGHSWSNSIEVMLGRRDSSFALGASVAVSGTPVSLVAGDFNGDGRADLAAAHAGASTIQVFIGAGNGSQTTTGTFAVGVSPVSIAVGDFNDDGFEDLAVANQMSDDVTILTGNGTGAFVAATTLSSPGQPQAIAAGDFTGDGRHDFAVANFVADNVSTFMNGCLAVTTVAPSIGSTRGGQTVTITGIEIDGASSVTFGGAAATITANTSTSITVVTPPHAPGMVDVIVTTPKGSATAANAYTFDAPPAINEAAFKVTPATIARGASVNASAEFSDGDGSAFVHTAKFDWGDGTTDVAAVTEPSASAPGRATGTHVYAAAGVFTVKVQVSDSTDSSTAFFRYVVVTDPEAGFVAGGGTIDSPAGAFAANPALTGKATFGFTMKYLKNQIAPQGAVEFHFQDGTLRFKSTAGEWLVVAGSKAQFRVAGTINGGGDYSCIITAVSGQPSGPDRLRIKIWDRLSGVVVYDNMRGAADDLTTEPPPISGGSITIH